MGTSSSFWIGDPRDLDSREWLGQVGMDGHLENYIDRMIAVRTEKGFRRVVDAFLDGEIYTLRPNSGVGWKTPTIWSFDWTVAWLGGRVMCTSYGRGFRPIRWFRDVWMPYWRIAGEEADRKFPDMALYMEGAVMKKDRVPGVLRQKLEDGRVVQVPYVPEADGWRRTPDGLWVGPDVRI